MDSRELQNIRIGVLGGGVSPERNISLESAQAAFDALRRQSIDATLIDITSSTSSHIKEAIIDNSIDLAFVALHGEFGEDGQIQKILEDLGIAYTGSDPDASYKAMDKVVSKNIFVENSISTPNFAIATSGRKLPENLSYPVVVKPHFCGSSLGVSIVDNDKDFLKAVDDAMALTPKLLKSEPKGVVVEEYIRGREVTVGILDEKALGVVEIVPKGGHYDYTAKYTDGMTEFIAPANLPQEVYRQIQELGFLASQALGCRQFCRVDLRLNEKMQGFVLEVNSIPGLTSHSLLPMSAKVEGIDFDELILRIAKGALYGAKKIQK